MAADVEPVVAAVLEPVVAAVESAAESVVADEADDDWVSLPQATSTAAAPNPTSALKAARRLRGKSPDSALGEFFMSETLRVVSKRQLAAM